MPIAELVDVQTMPGAQPLPPTPRQPFPHVFAVSSQTLPLVAVPHAASFAQSPHLLDGGHTSERQSFWVTHGCPAGRPHLLSPGKHVPERHDAFVVGGPHVVPFGRPQRLSAVLQTPD